MDIFKLFFNHDQRLDKLAKRNANKTKEEKEQQSSLEDFMKPDLTYSKFYITGTRLEDERFGLNTLEKVKEVLDQLGSVFDDKAIYSSHQSYHTLSTAVANTEIGQALVISGQRDDYNFDSLALDEESNVGHKKEELAEILKTGAFVLYKEQAHHGYDLHLFSMENIYPALFDQLKPLVDDDFRFFSINSKRMGSERHFYFETWTLGNPPHGAEEVFADTVL
jgi:hypothetical protein